MIIEKKKYDKSSNDVYTILNSEKKKILSTDHFPRFTGVKRIKFDRLKQTPQSKL